MVAVVGFGALIGGGVGAVAVRELLPRLRGREVVALEDDAGSSGRGARGGGCEVVDGVDTGVE